MMLRRQHKVPRARLREQIHPVIWVPRRGVPLFNEVVVDDVLTVSLEVVRPGWRRGVWRDVELPVVPFGVLDASGGPGGDAVYALRSVHELVG